MNMRKPLFPALIVSASAILVVIYIYFLLMSDAVSDRIYASIGELARHDIQSIGNYLDLNWNELENIAERLEIYDIDTIDELQKRLGLEEKTSSFDKLYFLGADKRLYGEGEIAVGVSGHNLEDIIQKKGNEERFAARYDFDDGFLEKGTLIYGINIDGVSIGGVECTAIVSTNDVSSIMKKYKLDSFEREESSAILDSDGNYIVYVENVLNAQYDDNFFQRLESADMKESVEQIKRQAMENGEYFFKYTDSGKVSKVSALYAIPSTNWYFLVEVPKETFARYGIHFIVLNVVMSIAITLVLVFLARMVINIRKQAVMVDPDYVKNILGIDSDISRLKAMGGGDGINILVAEDNDINAEIIMDILHEIGYRTMRARDGREAVEIFSKSKEGEIDAIIMDMHMPVLDGCEASAEIRGLDRGDAGDVAIYACTANTFKEDRDKAIESGMNDFLSKPIDINALLRKLEDITKDEKVF